MKTTKIKYPRDYFFEYLNNNFSDRISITYPDNSLLFYGEVPEHPIKCCKEYLEWNGDKYFYLYHTEEIDGILVTYLKPNDQSPELWQDRQEMLELKWDEECGECRRVFDCPRYYIGKNCVELGGHFVHEEPQHWKIEVENKDGKKVYKYLTD